MDTTAIIIALAVVIAVVAVIVLAVLGVIGPGRQERRARRRNGSGLDEPEPEQPPLPRAAIIVNPTKFDGHAHLAETRELVRQTCQEHGWGEPIWKETTKEDPGTGQATAAVAEGADVVCALGGDGTVRAVAIALVDTHIPMGLLPGGTGNLLARNLDVPVTDLRAALVVALQGRDELIDVGILRVRATDGGSASEEEHVFLVMAGMGFDASVMADAPERLKAQFGWPAYVVAGMRHLTGPPFRVDARIDDGPTFHRHVRTVVIGNVGRLQGGVELLPDAQASDGALDMVMLSPRGLLGWASVSAHIATRKRKGHPRVEHLRCRTMTLRLGTPQEVQVDGDPIGQATMVTFAVKPRCLRVRLAP